MSKEENEINEVKEILKKHHLIPKKYWGQNFLIDKAVLADIIRAADLKKNDVVLEIGPGLGTLTKELSRAIAKQNQNKKGKIIAIEKDPRLVKILKEELRGFKNVGIVQGDILKLTTDNLQLTTDYKVVANLPYYITSPVIRKFLETKNPPKLMVLMVQKEVAERICSRPPKMSVLTVACQFYAKPGIIRIVKKECFFPQPKVDSTIIKLTTKNLQTTTEFCQHFFKIVKAGFSSPRKQLKNNLKRELKLDEKTVEDWLQKNNLQPIQRPETLSVKDWINLTSNLPPSILLQGPQ